MGAFAEAVRDRLRDSLAERRPSLEWTTEHRIRRTPVDVAGRGPDRFVAVELEWRRIREGSERMLVRKRAKRVD